jgi:lysophospholipase L1-like esterase
MLFLRLFKPIIHMKTILCYGDSLTWGYNPENGMRYEYNQTWPGIMADHLGSEYHVITEALVGRTTCYSLPYTPFRNGEEYLPVVLESHAPINLVIVMLGINDLINMVDKTAEESAWGLIGYAREVFTPLFGGTPPKMLIVSPPALGKLSEFNKIAFEGKQEESKKLAGFQKTVAQTALCAYLDSNELVKASDVDGVHLLPDQLKILGEAIAKKVIEMKI